MIKSINPATYEELNTFRPHTPDEISDIIYKSHTAFLDWHLTPFNERAFRMMSAARILRAKIDEFSALMTLEMGKPISQSKAEVEKCAWVCDYYAENAEKFLEDELIKTDAAKSYVSYRPLGVVLAVMPWNFPLWQVFRFAAPNLMAGNAGILKHASNVTGCSLLIENVFAEAGFPPHLFRSIVVPSSEVESVISNKLVTAVTLTGSVPAGKAVAAAAGKVLKKTVLELGGSDPYLVLNDADIEMAAESCVNSRLINGGQSCIAAKRFIITSDVYDAFEELFVQKMKNKNMGDPFDQSNHLGPQASKKLRDELHEQVLESVKSGAKILTGGEIPDVIGAYYPPTVLSNVKPGMTAFDDELFGPVAALTRASDEEDAIKLANQSVFGLGAAVFTSDVARGEWIAREKLNAGCCFVNEFVKSDPRLPFGGIKESGYGRELSVHGIREFINIKSVYIK